MVFSSRSAAGLPEAPIQVGLRRIADHGPLAFEPQRRKTAAQNTGELMFILEFNVHQASNASDGGGGSSGPDIPNGGP
jgi:hypothetical protein